MLQNDMKKGQMGVLKNRGYGCLWAPSMYYVKPIALKFKINPEIPILYVVNTILTNFQSKILSPGLLPAI